MRLPVATVALSFAMAACSSSTYQGGPPPTEPDAGPEPRTAPAPRPAPDVPVEEVTGPSTAATLGIPPGHLPADGECRIWIPGAPPGRQDPARPCYGAVADAPANAMVLEGLSDDRRLVRVFYIGDRRNTVERVVIFEKQTGKFVRTEPYEPGPVADARPRPTDPPTADRPSPPPRPTPNRRRTEPSPPPSLEIAQRQLPDPGQCRVWMPATRPGRQPRAGSCDGAVESAPAGAMVIEGLSEETDHVRVTYIGERAGEVTRVLIFERRTGKFVRAEGG